MLSFLQLGRKIEFMTQNHLNIKETDSCQNFRQMQKLFLNQDLVAHNLQNY